MAGQRARGVGREAGWRQAVRAGGGARRSPGSRGAGGRGRAARRPPPPRGCRATPTRGRLPPPPAATPPGCPAAGEESGWEEERVSRGSGSGRAAGQESAALLVPSLRDGLQGRAARCSPNHHTPLAAKQDARAAALGGSPCKRRWRASWCMPPAGRTPTRGRGTAAGRRRLQGRGEGRRAAGWRARQRRARRAGWLRAAARGDGNAWTAGLTAAAARRPWRGSAAQHETRRRPGTGRRAHRSPGRAGRRGGRTRRARRQPRPSHP